jgi:hypothetical protein
LVAQPDIDPTVIAAVITMGVMILREIAFILYNIASGYKQACYNLPAGGQG